MKIIIYIAVIAALAMVLLTLYFKEHIDFIYKTFGILIGMLGVLFGGYSLYLNFLKLPAPSIAIGNKTLLVWHDVSLGSNPMLDIFCTIANDGANHLVVDGIEAELIDSSNNRVMLSDYLFLKT